MPIQLSGSLVITGSITTTGVITMSGSIASASYSSNSDLLQGTGSVGFTTTASFNAVSSSQQQISASYIALSGSYNTFSGSASTRITENSSSIQQVSSSQQQISASLLNVISIFATTGSNSFRANQSITGSLVVSSTITAQTLVVQTVTSSIVYSSGSNIFGCDLNSRQTFTGSVLITGSLTIAGASSATSYSGATIFGSTIACSPIGCFATSCATSFIGGTMSGTSIYASTVSCSPVGKFTSCIDAGSGTFSGNLLNTNSNFQTYGSASFGVSTWGLSIGNGNASANYYRANDHYFQNGAGTQTLQIASTGAATFTGANSADVVTMAAATAKLRFQPYASSGDSQIISEPTAGGSYNPLTLIGGTIKLFAYTGNNDIQLWTNNVQRLTIASTGAATFTNTETTFNYNPQTNLLASYNYINFGGGSIMYRNATDIYIGSNAKYGSAGTVVAGYTSLYGMGLLTMDAGTLNYQANNTSVTAGTAYGVPIRFTIKGDGNIGIGASSPCGKLQVVLPAYTNEDTDSQQAIFGSCTNGYGVRIGYNESCNAGYINSLKPGVAWSKLSLQGSSIVFAPTSTERVRVTTDGLTFNGDTAAANALDDYEEGTFTPTIIGSSTAGTATYNVANGLYTKIGRAVTYNLYIDWASGTGTGNLRVDGLPFTSVNINVYPSSAIGETGGVTLGANGIMTARVNPNSTQIFISQYPAGGGSAASVTYDSAGYLVLAGTYYV